MALLKKPMQQVAGGLGLPGDVESLPQGPPNQTGLPIGAPPPMSNPDPDPGSIYGPIGNSTKPGEAGLGQQPTKPLGGGGGGNGAMGGSSNATPTLPVAPSPVAGMTPNPVSPGGIPPTPPSFEAFNPPNIDELVGTRKPNSGLLGFEGGLLGGGMGAPGQDQTSNPSDLLLMLTQLLNQNG